MQVYEILIIILCVLFVLLVIFFSIRKHIKNKGSICSDCFKNNSSRILKEYRKKYPR